MYVVEKYVVTTVIYGAIHFPTMMWRRVPARVAARRIAARAAATRSALSVFSVHSMSHVHYPLLHAKPPIVLVLIRTKTSVESGTSLKFQILLKFWLLTRFYWRHDYSRNREAYLRNQDAFSEWNPGRSGEGTRKVEDEGSFIEETRREYIF